MDNPTPSERQAFDELFYSLAREFAEQALALCPELCGLAVVPGWDPRQTEVPPAMLKGRDGPDMALIQPAHIIRVGENLLKAFGKLVDNAHTSMRAVDRRMGEMAEEIKRLKEEIDVLNSRRGRPDTPGPG